MNNTYLKLGGIAAVAFVAAFAAVSYAQNH
jgi:hypothetical protein